MVRYFVDVSKKGRHTSLAVRKGIILTKAKKRAFKTFAKREGKQIFFVDAKTGKEAITKVKRRKK